MKGKILCLSALTIALSLSQSVMACGDKGCSKHMKNHHSESRMDKVVEKLDLSTEQKAKIKVIRTKARADMAPEFKKLHALRHEKNQLVAEPKMNEHKLDKIIHQEKEAWGAIMKIRAMERHDISMELTPKQKEKMKEMTRKWEEKHAEKMTQMFETRYQ